MDPITETERALIGEIFRDPSCLDTVAGIVSPEHFFSDLCRSAYSSMMGLRAVGAKVDRIAVHNELAGMDVYEKAGGAEFLHSTILVDAIAPVMAKETAKIIKTKALMRTTARSAHKIMSEALAGRTAGVGEIISEADQIRSAFDSLHESKTVSAFELCKKYIDETLSPEDRGGIREEFIGTGYADLDAQIIGLPLGGMVVAAGRPSMGKTTFALNVALNACQLKIPTLFFSLEMSERQIWANALCSLARVNSHRWRKNMIAQEDRVRLELSLGSFADLPFWVNECQDPVIDAVMAQAAAAKTEHGIKLVVIDYLQLISPGKAKVDTREQEVSHLSRSIKRMARQLGVAVLVAAQLNRAAEIRTDHRPRLSDLRESGSIEQEADCVLMLYRDDYYNPQSQEAGKCEVIVAKQRNGPTGTVWLTFLRDYGRFENFSPVPQPDQLPQGSGRPF